jgi:hypothetical protein
MEFSSVKGYPKAISATQQSSAHHFQRPDAKHISFDSTLTSLSGYGSTLKLGRSSKKLIQFETSFTVRSPGLEFNDLGYMRYSDFFHHGSWLVFYKRNPFAIFNNLYINTNYWMFWDYSGKHMTTLFNTNWHTEFKNRWYMNFNLTRELRHISNDLLCGGPSFHVPGGTEGNLNVFTDQTKKLWMYAGNYRGYGDLGSYRAYDYYGGITAQPMDANSISIEPDYLIVNTQLQYVQTISSEGDSRYIFGEMGQKTLLMTIRMNFTINPELSVEYYGQPFVSAGKYSRFKKKIVPDAGRYEDRYHIFGPEEISYNAENRYNIDENLDYLTDYSFDNPDFNFRQFRSNLVIPWEYLPLSTLFLVWSQGRTNSVSEDSFSYANDIKDLFNSKANNVFLIKLSYRFSVR